MLLVLVRFSVRLNGMSVVNWFIVLFLCDVCMMCGMCMMCVVFYVRMVCIGLV